MFDHFDDKITCAQLATLLAQTPDLQLIDVRQPTEHDQAHIPQSQLIPLDLLPNQLNGLDKHKPIVVYCRSDYRSQQALALLKAHQFDQVKYLQGGMIAWLETQS